MKNPEAKSLLHCQIQAKHPPLPRLLPGCTRPRPGSSGAAPARTPLLRGCTRPFPFSSGATPARTPAPGSPAAAEGRPRTAQDTGLGRRLVPAGLGAPEKGSHPISTCTTRCFSLLSTNLPGLGFIARLRAAAAGLRAPRGPGSSQGCPRRSPGRSPRLRPLARRPRHPPRRCPTASEENAPREQRHLPTSVTFWESYFAGLSSGPWRTKTPFEHAQLYCSPLCGHVCARRLQGPSRSRRWAWVPGSGSGPTLLDAPLVLAPILTDPKPRDAWDGEVGVKTRRHLAGEGGPTWASGLAGRCA